MVLSSSPAPVLYVMRADGGSDSRVSVGPLSTRHCVTVRGSHSGWQGLPQKVERNERGAAAQAGSVCEVA